MKVGVTGGAGFIGSHLTDRLIDQGNEVLVIDNLSSGKKEYLNKKAGFIKKDIRNDISKELTGIETVFHLAADPDVRGSATDPRSSYENNVYGTFMLLESCRKADVKHIVFASTSTVYGESEVIPTSEAQLCIPISNYGASKLACEAYLSSYSSSYGIKATALRYANIFGERSTHGVMIDFYKKLMENPRELEILGDGKQDKSYLHVSDCVEASLMAWGKQQNRFDYFNVGSPEKKTVDEIAKILCAELGLRPKLSYTGTKRGWVGDVKLMLLDLKKLESLGWKQKVGFEDGVKRYLNWLKSAK